MSRVPYSSHMETDPTTEELRLEQLQREDRETRAAEAARMESLDEDTAQHARRADKASYLREKLDERAEAERRKAAGEDDG